MILRSSSRYVTRSASENKKRKLDIIPIHGPAESIKRRRQSFEASRSPQFRQLRDISVTSSKVQEIHSGASGARVHRVVVKAANQKCDCSGNQGTGLKAVPLDELEPQLEPTLELQLDLSEPQNCKSPPCVCTSRSPSKEVCVIRKCEKWLNTRPPDWVLQFSDQELVRERESQEMRGPGQVLVSEQGAEQHIQHTVTALPPHPPSVTLSRLAGLPHPVYIVNVRVVGMQPTFQGAPHRLVRGHCSHFPCNQTVPAIEWDKSGPEHYGKILRPYCPHCSKGERQRHYLDLYFHLEMKVIDNSRSEKTVIVQRETAMRFFGCSVYKFLTDKDCSSKVQSMLDALYRKCSPNPITKAPGMAFEVRVTPVAYDKLSEVQFHLCGDNEPLFSIVSR